MTTKTLNNISEIASLPLVMQSKKQFGELCWWRGHSDAQWSLKPNVFRKEKGLSYEKSIIEWFQAQAHIRHINLPSTEDYYGWLSFAQHFGLPTRLLDWTQSILIASYFCCEKDHGKDGAIWCLQPSLMNKVYLQIEGLCSPQMYPHLFKDPFFFQIKREEPEYQTPNIAAAIVPKNMDMRMLQQLSMFTVHNDSFSLEDNPESSSFLMKFTIPKESKSNVLLNLNTLGITRSNLFPDLQNLAKFISEQDFQYLDDRHRKDTQLYLDIEKEEIEKQSISTIESLELLAESIGNKVIDYIKPKES